MTEVAKHASLTEALIAAQMAFGIVRKDATNPHFKAKYADLATVIDAVLPSLNANGIALTQPVERDETGMVLRTRLIHTSGQELVSEVPLPHATQWQQWGSALTYARRYTLMALLGVAPEDDDGNEAAGALPAAKGKNVTPLKREQPLEAPEWVKLVDVFDNEFLKLPGEVEQWIREQVDGTDDASLPELVAKNPDRQDVRVAVANALIEAQDTVLAGVRLSAPARSPKSEPAGSTPTSGRRQPDAQTEVAKTIAAELKAADLADRPAIWMKNWPLIEGLRPKLRERLEAVRDEGAPRPAPTDDNRSFDADIAHLEPPEWRTEEGRVEDPRQPELLA